MSASFDWQALFRRYRVPYATSGRNVRAGEINIRCPRCGEADPSFHMAISPSGGWVCRRVREHRGRSRAHLIQLVLRCSDEEARRLAGYDELERPTDDDLQTKVDRMRGVTGGAARKRPPVLPSELHALLDGRRFAQPYLAYLAGRGYGRAELEWVAREYDLRYATTGPFIRRVIFPIRDRRGALISWTGRAISSVDTLRYLTLSERSDRAAYGQVAAAPSSDLLLGLPSLVAARDARALVICEGPMDAVRLSLYGRPLGVYATCLFGLNASERQVEEVEAVADRFRRVWLCIDSGEEMRRGTLLSALVTVRARALELPAGVGDPGELSPAQAVALCARAAE